MASRWVMAWYSVDGFDVGRKVELVTDGLVSKDQVATRLVRILSGMHPGEVIDHIEWEPCEAPRGESPKPVQS